MAMSILLIVGLTTGMVGAVTDSVSAFKSGIGGYHTYRIPSMIAVVPAAPTASPTLLMFVEGRKFSSADHDWNDILMKRSHDGGRTWDVNHTLVWSESTSSEHVVIGNPSPVALANGSVLLLFCRNNLDIAVTISHDVGSTWTRPRYFGSTLHYPAGDGFMSHIATGPPGELPLSMLSPPPPPPSIPSGGLQVRGDVGSGSVDSNGSGLHKMDRLVVPATACRTRTKGSMVCHGVVPGGGTAFALLSDDGGITWRVSKTHVPDGNEVPTHPN